MLRRIGLLIAGLELFILSMNLAAKAYAQQAALAGLEGYGVEYVSESGFPIFKN